MGVGLSSMNIGEEISMHVAAMHQFAEDVVPNFQAEP
jgi:hypothetical protein